MKKKLACLILAVAMLLVVVPSVADSVQSATRTVSRGYNAGYSVLNYNSFNTGNLSKDSNEAWVSVTDDAIETYFVDPDTGIQSSGNHYTSLYGSSGQICSERSVAFSGSTTFSQADMGSASISENNIHLHIRNGAADGRGYKTKGTFKATIHMYV